jgi:hypothetical protein
MIYLDGSEARQQEIAERLSSLAREELKRGSGRQSGDLWHEYGVTQHLAAVRWSRGLRTAMLGPLGPSELTDDELAIEDVDGELITSIAIDDRRHLRRAALDHAVLAVAERGGLPAVRALIGSLGCG